jgi:hypothetical protein
MTIGYAVEGSTDRAFVTGLRERWCPQALLVEGAFRGSTGLSLRREYKKICDEFAIKGVNVMVFLTDGNGADWRDVQKNEREHFPEERRDQAIHGVCDRNIESWICRDRHWISHRLGGEAATFEVEDPKHAFERAIGITRDDRKEAEIAALVAAAPLNNWLSAPSFEDFYEQARDLSQTKTCEIENLRNRN